MIGTMGDSMDLAIRMLIERAPHDTLSWSILHRPTVASPAGRRVVYDPYDYQINVLRSLDEDRNCIVLKSRQVGISVTSQVHLCSRVQRGGQSILVVSINQDESRDYLRKFKRTYSSCSPPPDVVPVYDNVDRIEFSNGSVIEATTSSKTTGRGGTYGLVIMDEVESLPNADDMWASIGPTISRGGSVCMISTPGLEGSLFHRMWMDAEANGWDAHRIDWRMCPDYGDEWYAEMRSRYSANQWASEFECEWGRTGDALFSPESINASLSEFRRLYPFGFQPTKDSSFRMGVDLAGSGSDRTVIVVLDDSVDPAALVTVRVIDDAPAPVQQAVIREMMQEYPCVPWIDRTGLGWGVFGNLGADAVGVAFTAGDRPHHVPRTRNWNVPRDMMISELALGLESGSLLIPESSVDLVTGLRGASAEKAASPNADHVDALMLAWWSSVTDRRRARRVSAKPRWM